MVKGILTSAGAMRPALLAHGVLANNLANASTTGFRQDRVAFRQGWRPALPTAGGELAAAAPEMLTRVDPRPGGYQVTDRPLDVAIQGEGFFVVQSPEGERYTRSGHFFLADDGTLVTARGYPVLADGGPITLPPGVDVRITNDGMLRDEKRAFGKLQLVTFEEEPSLTHAGASLLATDSEAVAAVGARVLQGVLEGPNVEPIQAMVEMITLLRHFEMNQKALQAQDESLGNLLSWVRA